MMILTGFHTGILRNSFQASGSKSPYIFMKLHTDLLQRFFHFMTEKVKTRELKCLFWK